MIFSVAGDVHGEIRLLYERIRRWQQNHKTLVDYVLQVGDLGVMGEKVYQRERRSSHVKNNPDELDLYRGMEEDKLAAWAQGDSGKYSSVEAPIIFVDGNHDDIAYIRSEASVGNWGPLRNVAFHLFHLPRGKSVRLPSSCDKPIRVGGIGGIEPFERPSTYRRRPEVAFTEDDVTEALSCEGVDIFLSHQHPRRYEFAGDGSSQLRTLIEIIEPSIYFFGHKEISEEPFWIGDTQCTNLHRLRKTGGNCMVFFKHEKSADAGPRQSKIKRLPNNIG